MTHRGYSASGHQALSAFQFEAFQFITTENVPIPFIPHLGVETFNLNKAVKRNIDRFSEDFMFQLSKGEADSLRFQIGMSKETGRRGRRYLPYVFTEQGVAMLSSVLNSKRAVHVN